LLAAICGSVADTITPALFHILPQIAVCTQHSLQSLVASRRGATGYILACRPDECVQVIFKINIKNTLKQKGLAYPATIVNYLQNLQGLWYASLLTSMLLLLIKQWVVFIKKWHG
jgi:hypothetical protein